jgi:hypothetical protein
VLVKETKHYLWEGQLDKDMNDEWIQEFITIRTRRRPVSSFFIRWIRVVRVRFLLYELDKFDEFFVAYGENQRSLPTGKSKSNKI